MALLKGFGRVKIWLINEDLVIKNPFYRANKNSISVISSTYKSDAGRTQYISREIPIEQIRRLKWKHGRGGIGALIGLGAGVVGGVLYVNNPNYSHSSDGFDSVVITAAVGTIVGALAGSLSGKPSRTIWINGDQALWEQGKSKLPPSGFRAHCP